MKACNSCSQPIIWRQGKKKWRAYNPDGSRHSRTCPFSKGYKPPRQEEVSKPSEIAAPWIRGEHYRESCGRCGLPPWHSCACSAVIPAREIRLRTSERLNEEADERLELVLEGTS